MNKYVVINIQSAKFPMPNGKDSDDFVRNRQNRELIKRELGNCCEFGNKESDVFTVHQVSGMLHVLLGARPVSYMYGNNYSSSSVIDEMAKNALVKTDSKFFWRDKKEKIHTYGEFTQSNKNHYNSNKKGVVTMDEDGNIHIGKITWESMKRHFMIQSTTKYGNKYDYIMSFLHSICPDEELFKKYNLIDFLKILSKDEDKKNKMNDFFENEITFNKGGLPFYNVINAKNGTKGLEGSNCGNNLAAQTTTKGVKNKVCVNGTIVIPVTSEQAQDFLKGVRTATFGDGGLAFVESIITSDEDTLIDEEDFNYINN